MKRTSYVFVLLLTLVVSVQSFASTVLWYDFEDLVSRAGLQSNPGTAAAVVSADLSGNGYGMYGWASATQNNSPYVSDVGETAYGDGVAIEFTGGQDGYCYDAGLVNWSPEAWTMEFSFKCTTVTANKTMIGKDGSAGLTVTQKSALYIQTSTQDVNYNVRIQFVSTSMEEYNLTTSLTPVAGQWYNMVIRCDGQYLDIFADSLDGSGFVNVGNWDLDALGSGDVDHSIKVTGTWTFGRGYYGGNADFFNGSLDDIRFSDVALDEAEFLQNAGRVVGNPAPANNEVNVFITEQLSWSEFTDETVTGYNVYFSSDPNVYAAEPNSFVGATPYYTTAMTVDPAVAFTALENSDTYGWRVDAFIAGQSEPVVGPVWTFTTAPKSVLILTEPKAMIASPDATFTVVASEATDYRWYKEVGGENVEIENGAIYSGVYSNTLTVTGAGLAEEGLYKCYVTNDLPSEAWSTAVNLWTKRMVAHWKFDDNMTDSITELYPDVAAHNGSLGIHTTAPANAGNNEFTYTTGINGNAIQFTNDADHVAIADSNYFNFYPQGFTVSLWYKLEGANPGWRLPMCKLDAGSAGWLFGVDHSARNEGVMIIETGSWLHGNADVNTGDGQWHMMTVTYDPAATSMKFYTDGDYSNVMTVDLAKFGLPTAPVTIGGRNTENSIRGAIDDVRMYTTPLSDAEVAQLYIDMVPTAYICIESDPALV
ncbi:MAG: hypothetical protein JW745_04365, partial [Sedimentisphaerales bacterium]|nr:hypothetical protein [Sedimentisphaerales bacterium]